MFIRFSGFLPVIALVAVAAAVPSALEARDSSNCNTGPIQCCQSTQESNPETLSEFSSLLGIQLPNIEGLLALQCTPITLLGTGTGADCTTQAVCCTDNSFSGLINLGCSPVNLSL